MTSIALRHWAEQNAAHLSMYYGCAAAELTDRQILQAIGLSISIGRQSVRQVSEQLRTQ